MKKALLFMKYKFISIEGNIGAGKTSLATKISQDFNSDLILESFAENPFLPSFYKEPEKYAFSLELFFMAERYSQLKSKSNQNLFLKSTVSDYFFMKSKLFAKNNLNNVEQDLFNRLFDIMMNSMPKPDILIYLFSDIKRLQDNIKKRNREFEQNISDEYLQNIQDRYLDFLKKQQNFTALIIDVTNCDFVNKESDYKKIRDLLTSNYPIGLTKINLFN